MNLSFECIECNTGCSIFQEVTQLQPQVTGTNIAGEQPVATNPYPGSHYMTNANLGPLS